MKFIKKAQYFYPHSFLVTKSIASIYSVTRKGLIKYIGFNDKVNVTDILNKSILNN